MPDPAPGLEIVDAYCGLGPWRQRDPLLPYQPAEILKLMDHFGIAQALTYANQAADRGHADDANAILLQTAAAEPRFLPAAVLTPADGGAAWPARRAWPKQYGVRAVWLFPQSTGQAHGLWPWLVGELLEACSAHRLPLFLTMEQLTPNDVHELCRNFPALRVVLAGVGYTANDWLFPLLGKHPHLNVCLGQFYIPPLGPNDLVDAFGPERLIFGSNLPHFTPGGLLGHVLYSDLRDRDKALILGGNLRRLLAEVTL